MRRLFALFLVVSLAGACRGDTIEGAGPVDALRLRCDGARATTATTTPVLLTAQGVRVVVENVSDKPLRLAGAGGPDIAPGAEAELFVPLAPGKVEAGCDPGVPALVEVVDPDQVWTVPDATLDCGTGTPREESRRGASESAEDAARQVLDAGAAQFVVNLDGAHFGVWDRGRIVAVTKPVEDVPAKQWVTTRVQRCP